MMYRPRGRFHCHHADLGSPARYGPNSGHLQPVEGEQRVAIVLATHLMFPNRNESGVQRHHQRRLHIANIDVHRESTSRHGDDMRYRAGRAVVRQQHPMHGAGRTFVQILPMPRIANERNGNPCSVHRLIGDRTQQQALEGSASARPHRDRITLLALGYLRDQPRRITSLPQAGKATR